jgi:ABC-type transport system substrate-binding protein
VTAFFANVDWPEIARATRDTLLMLGGSMVLTVALGIPLGVLLLYPAFDALLVRAGQELDDPRREAVLQQATRMLVEDAGIIPTHLQKNVWAMRQGFVHVPRVDERTRAQDVRPAGR